MPSSAVFVSETTRRRALEAGVRPPDSAIAHSGSFGSYEEAAHAGSYVRDGAESARFERRAAKDRDPCETAASDDLDVGRWLDEGGSFRS